MNSKLILCVVLTFGSVARAVELKDLNVGNRGRLTDVIKNAEITCIKLDTRQLERYSVALAPMNLVGGLNLLNVDELTVVDVYRPKGNLSDIFTKYKVTFKSDRLDSEANAICSINVTQPEIGFQLISSSPWPNF